MAFLVDKRLSDAMTIRHQFQVDVTQWYQHHGRKHLPWQTKRSAYRVWISEIMLQQTQVATVIPYFNRFMRRFPTITTLANATHDEVMQHWSGLGYYTRARNCHASAKIIVDIYKGRFPTTFEQIVALPGIGRTTAGAILSLALGKSFPILDGNVKRVLARAFMISGSTSSTATLNTLWQLTTALTPTTHVRPYNQAMMDIGATLCLRRNPQCAHCPIQAHCMAYQNHKTNDYPEKRNKLSRPVRTVCMAMLVNAADHCYLTKRPAKGIWGGLWSFPEFTDLAALHTWQQGHLPGGCKEVIKLPGMTHQFTHFTLEITCYVIRLNHEWPTITGGEWFDIAATLTIGVPAVVNKLRALYKETSHDTNHILFKAAEKRTRA